MLKGSVATSEQAGFSKLLDKMESRYVQVVTKLDRLGRSGMDVRSTVEAQCEMGARTHGLALGGADLGSPACASPATTADRQQRAF